MVAIAFMLAPIDGQSQVEGKVTSELGQLLGGVNVIKVGTSKHTHTDNRGLFKFEGIQKGDSLEFSFLAHKTVVILIDNPEIFLNVQLLLQTITVDQVTISPEIDATQFIAKINLQAYPVNSSQEVLRQVPGLFIGQHAGGGKAEQIFLRGFDVDHGTDVSLSVDGIPVNMVSHAHGQGYADLHFLIPETIEEISFGKGPYYSEQGNFNTAGFVGFRTKERLDHSEIKLEYGQFNTSRLAGLINVLSTEKHSIYVATEFNLSDGPFESSQDLNRFAGMVKYVGNVAENEKIEVLLSHFNSRWNASGQIPQRAVNAGLISRFGAIDDTEGGTTSRTNASIKMSKFLNHNSLITNQIFFSAYDFELFSNFTFFLNDSVNGDQIRQKERRAMFGFKSEYKRMFSLHHGEGIWTSGISLRSDQTQDSELSRTMNREITLSRIQFGSIGETNFGAYTGLKLHSGKWSVNPSVRFDYFDFRYEDGIPASYTTKSAAKSIVTPSLTFTYGHNETFQEYFKIGRGFHSNDTRVVLGDLDREILPSAYGLDLGFIWKPIPNLLINSAYWYLLSEQEFVYVGDEGIVEPSGQSIRHGFDISGRLSVTDWLMFTADFNYANAQADENGDSGTHIPLAPRITALGGFSLQHKSGFHCNINVRHMGDRPANEDNSIVARGYTIVDVQVGMTWKRLALQVRVQNLLNSKWNETQFATESRLFDELNSVEEIHFTPGTPLFAMASISYQF